MASFKGNPVVGEGKCYECGAPVELRVEKEGRGRVYYMCDGTLARKCTGTHRFNPDNSEKLKASDQGGRDPNQQETDDVREKGNAEPGDGGRGRERHDGDDGFL